MDELLLIQPDETMLDEIAAYRKSMLDAGSAMDGCSALMRLEAAEWLDFVRALSSEETCPPHWVPATQLVCIRKKDGRIVGMLDLRHRLNEFLAEYGGHIGYSVRPDERRKGYAKRMLGLALPEGKKRGIDLVLITCDEDNVGSRCTIEANGGLFERNTYLDDEKQTVSRYWIAL